MKMGIRLRCLSLLLVALTQTAAQPPGPRQPYAPSAPTTPAIPTPPTFAAVARPTTYPIDLATALRLVDANSPTLGVARARVKEAIAQLDRARVAWVPNLAFGPSFFYHDGIDQNRRGDIFTVARGFYALGAGPTIRVDLSDALYLPLVARQGVRAASARASATLNGTQLDVAIAYLDLVELHALLAINADILARTEQILRSAQVGEKANANKTAADVNRAQTEVSLRREEGIVLRGRAAAAAARLTGLLALDPAVELVPYEHAVVPLVLVPGETTLEQLVQMGLRGRPEMAAAHALVAAADALLRQSKMAPYLPRLQGEFIGGGMSGGRNDDFSPLQSQYNASVALVWNLEAFGMGNAASIRGRQAGLEVELHRLRETEALVSSQVVEAAQLAAARFATLTAAQEAVKQAQEMYRKFRDASFGMVGPKGQFDALETLTAVQALNQSRVQYLQQVVEFNRAQFRLYAAIGQPPLYGLDAAVSHAVEIPVIPPAGSTAPTPPVSPRPMP